MQAGVLVQSLRRNAVLPSVKAVLQKLRWPLLGLLACSVVIMFVEIAVSDYDPNPSGPFSTWLCSWKGHSLSALEFSRTSFSRYSS